MPLRPYMVRSRGGQAVGGAASGTVTYLHSSRDLSFAQLALISRFEAESWSARFG